MNENKNEKWNNGKMGMLSLRRAFISHQLSTLKNETRPIEIYYDWACFWMRDEKPTSPQCYRKLNNNQMNLTISKS